MIIKGIDPGSHSKYGELLTLYGSLFESPQWLDLFGENIVRYGLYDSGDNLTGGFSVFSESKYGFSICSNPPLTPWMGPFFRNEAKNPVRAMDKRKQIISLIAEFIHKMNYAVVSLSFDKKIIDMQPFVWRDFKVITQYTYVMDLALSVGDLWKNMSSEKRGDINKGTKDGLVVRQINDFAIVKRLVLKTFLRQNKTINDSFMNKVLSDFSNDSNSFAFATFHNGNPVACTFFVRDSKTGYALLAGYDSENKHQCAGALCQWEAIQYARSLGLPYLDFLGSMVPAIECYQRGFGGKLTPYYRVNKAKLPFEIALKFLKRRLF